MSEEHDPYVRHSGMSVAANSTPGMLSARGPWEPDHLQQFQSSTYEEADDQQQQQERQSPKELLDNGEAKPIVTLIDFPQMVSTQHPNAKEFYERDTTCLYKFFSHKLQFQIPEAEKESLFLTWEALQEELQRQNGQDGNDMEGVPPTVGNANGADDGTASVCLASKAQLRLDQELKASGYSMEDASRDMELYYYYNQDTNKDQDEQAIAEENDDEEEEKDQVAETLGNHEEGYDDDGSIESAEEGRGRETASVVSYSSSRSRLMIASEQLTNMDREQLQEQARLRVQQQLDTQKRKNRQRGAFRKSNSNKSYVKGKRVFQDVGLQ